MRNKLFDSLTPPENSSIWRFMDLFKFIDLISSQKITLANLTAMKDPYDGMVHEDMKIEWVGVDGKPEGIPPENFPVEFNDSIKNTTFISCRHENEYENAGMWEGYGNNGIAIKTTVQKFKKSISFDDYNEMDLLRVNYYKNLEDYFIPARTEFDVYTGILNKRISFSHENEVRLIWHPRDYSSKSKIRKIDVNLNELIDDIYLSPHYAKWQYDSIVNLLKSLGLSLNIHKSSLYELK